MGNMMIGSTWIRVDIVLLGGSQVGSQCYSAIQSGEIPVLYNQVRYQCYTVSEIPVLHRQ